MYMALADYMAVDFGELAMTEGEMVEVFKMGEDGWWFVRSVNSGQSGWAPGSYLEPVNKRHSRTSLGSSIGKCVIGAPVLSLSMICRME